MAVRDPLLGLLDHFAVGRTDVFRLLLPLAIDLGLLVADLADLHALPQPQVEVLHAVELLQRARRGPSARISARLPRPTRTARRRSISIRLVAQLIDGAGHLHQALAVQRDVQGRLDPFLAIVIRRPRTDEHNA